MSTQTAVNAYDATPYPNSSHFQTHPDRLAAMARLMGLDPTPPDKARILEIGTGAGSNLINMALTLEGSELLGVDLAELPISIASGCVRDLGLTNVRFQQADLCDLKPEDLGKFDYIIAHGVFSWVPEPVRESMLRLCRETLTDHGIAMISYNAYPGGHIRDMVRHIMRFHVRAIESPKEKISQALSFLKMLSDTYKGQPHPYNGGYRQSIVEEFDRAMEYDPSALFHDDLAEINTPYYFCQFTAMAGDFGLQFVSETELREMTYSSFPPDVIKLLSDIERTDFDLKEQYLDFFMGRRFRQSIVCKSEVQIDRFLRREKVLPLHVHSFPAVQAKLDVGEDKDDVFTIEREAMLTVKNPTIKSAIRHLVNCTPKSVPYEVLENLYGKEDPLSFARWIVTAAQSGILSFRALPDRFTTEAGARPVVSPLARWQIANSANITSLGHTTIFIGDEPTKIMIPLLDGSRDRRQLAEEVAEESVRRGIEVEFEGSKVKEADEIREIMPKKVDWMLHEMGRLSILAPSAR